MIRFKLLDENNSQEYVITLDFDNSEDFLDFCDEDEDFETFMEQMECGSDDWCGVHDGTGGVDEDGIEWDGYHSYEIKNFPQALTKWQEFFQGKNKLIS